MSAAGEITSGVVHTIDERVMIAVVLASSRPMPLGDRVCKFVLHQASRVDTAELRVINIVDYGLPFFDEQLAPLNNPDRTPAESVRDWLDDVSAADGYLFLAAEYNYAVPAILKNALDFLAGEAEGKPASILSYSDTSHGGNIAGHELRLILNKLGMLPMPKSLPLAHADRLLDHDGRLTEQSPWAEKVAQFVPWSLTELARYAVVLRQLRVERPGAP